MSVWRSEVTQREIAAQKVTQDAELARYQRVLAAPRLTVRTSPPKPIPNLPGKPPVYKEITDSNGQPLTDSNGRPVTILQTAAVYVVQVANRGWTDAAEVNIDVASRYPVYPAIVWPPHQYDVQSSLSDDRRSVRVRLDHLGADDEIDIEIAPDWEASPREDNETHLRQKFVKGPDPNVQISCRNCISASALAER